MLRYKTRPGLVALYDIWWGNGAGLFLQTGARTGQLWLKEQPWLNEAGFSPSKPEFKSCWHPCGI